MRAPFVYTYATQHLNLNPKTHTNNQMHINPRYPPQKKYNRNSQLQDFIVGIEVE